MSKSNNQKSNLSEFLIFSIKAFLFLVILGAVVVGGYFSYSKYTKYAELDLWKTNWNLEIENNKNTYFFTVYYKNNYDEVKNCINYPEQYCLKIYLSWLKSDNKYGILEHYTNDPDNILRGILRNEVNKYNNKNIQSTINQNSESNTFNDFLQMELKKRMNNPSN